jgi:hypothetical protein
MAAPTAALHKPEVFEKHKIYASAYKAGDTFWGIGIECEGYIETAIRRRVRGASFLTDQRAERYSVPYYKTYRDGVYNQALKGLPAAAICESAAAAAAAAAAVTCQPSAMPSADTTPAAAPPQVLFDEAAFYDLPFLLNAHSFVRTDISGEHTTRFLKVEDAADRRGYRYDTVPNSRCQQTILSKLADADPYFKVTDDIRGEDFIFDGDSIEIATRNFYKTSIEECIQEFKNMRSEFVENLNNAWVTAGLPPRFQPLRWMRANYPFAVLHSNPKNIAIFNNGTYHFNFTMPTMLGSTAKPIAPAAFIRRHQKAARYIQWLEPFLIANYGTADPLSKSTIMGHRFSAASQRGAVSRYIGVGSYNTRKMPQGKMNTVSYAETRVTKEDGWMTSYLRGCAYRPLEEVGMDINFHKHYNHGLELRFFDYFAEERLTSVLSTLVHTLDHSQTVTLQAAGDSALWNTIVEEVMVHGKQTQIYRWMAAELSAALALEIRPGPIRTVWHDIQRQLERRWLGRGECSRVMIRRERYLWEHIERPLGPAAPDIDPNSYLRSNPNSRTNTTKRSGVAVIPIESSQPFYVQNNPLVTDRQPLISRPKEIPEVGQNQKQCAGCCTQ